MDTKTFIRCRLRSTDPERIREFFPVSPKLFFTYSELLSMEAEGLKYFLVNLDNDPITLGPFAVLEGQRRDGTWIFIKHLEGVLNPGASYDYTD